MTGGNDNILARWSRRKLAKLLDEAPASHEAEHEPDEITAADGAPVSQPSPSETEAEELDAEVVEPLPRVEDLTAESDVTAFLKKGVPMELKQAALRRIWSLDSGIRDYVGPSENAWDFNQPGSMAGFGPLDAKKAVVSFLSKAAHAIDSVAQPLEAAPTVDLLQDQPRDAAPTVEKPEASPAVELPGAEPLPVVAGAGVSLSVEGEAHSPLPDGSSSFQLPETFARPRHGGAMPR
ncbi:hypothetical protein ASD64_18760 [Mesorhizobium sp. Root157]|uniref:DUF3306 domain-containing protein n=1 Tax=Mesorhizobium sp. Root157 TaxID=1736477 RepID=UPI0007020792|nr:DUF3306 domain-containing protein [Mesorhizobium sp. Root157]KQZ95325.1 hypothetical protein ASD64_18760 [Mesorhizobium sp. Root157]